MLNLLLITLYPLSKCELQNFLFLIFTVAFKLPFTFISNFVFQNCLCKTFVVIFKLLWYLPSKSLLQNCIYLIFVIIFKLILYVLRKCELQNCPLSNICRNIYTVLLLNFLSRYIWVLQNNTTLTNICH